jgi:pyruvate dehydrogenase E2 component (dihydrolipoamide acetyltransferase)
MPKCARLNYESEVGCSTVALQRTREWPMSELVMPRLSDTMEEGTVLRWLKHDGEHVRRGEELVEIETDKAAMTYESDLEGVLETVAQEGDTLAVGELIARVGEPDAETTPGGAAAGRNGSPANQAQPSARSGPKEQPQPSAPDAQPPPPSGERIKASPLARRIARETGIELQKLAGSGPGGRIVKADVRAAMPTMTTPQPAPSPSSPPLAGDVTAAKGETTSVELSRTQRTIARRMAESKATIPDFTLRLDIDMQRCVELRGELKRLGHAGGSPASELPGGGSGSAPTYNDMVVKASALALREYPRANGSYRDGRFELHSRVNVGVAVAVESDDPLQGALVVPTVFDADTKSLGEIARETRALAERVREGTVTPPELGGGTFTVSNLGMYGIASFTAIVNPPQAAILAVGAVARRAVVVDGGDESGLIVARHTMTVTLACDHRILYGADAASFLKRIRELLEEPAALTL